MKNTSSLIKNFFLVILLSALAGSGYAQDRSLDSLYPYQLAFTNSNDVYSITGAGNFFTNSPKPGANDDVLLYPGWQKGVVNFENGKQLRDVDLEFNLVTNELYFNNNNKVNRFADNVSSFSLLDTSGGITKVATFKNGYPKMGQSSAKTFYLVLAAGSKVHLLKNIYKRKLNEYQYNGPSKTIYVIKEQLLVYNVANNTLREIKGGSSSLLKALPAYTTIIHQFADTEKTKHITDETILTIVRAINSQP